LIVVLTLASRLIRKFSGIVDVGTSSAADHVASTPQEQYESLKELGLHFNALAF